MSTLAAARADNFQHVSKWTPRKHFLNKFQGQRPLGERTQKLDQRILVIRRNNLSQDNRGAPPPTVFFPNGKLQCSRAALLDRRIFLSSTTLTFLAYSLVGEPDGALGLPKRNEPQSPYDEERLLKQNRRMQRLNNAPVDFPGFVREGFEVRVVTNQNYLTSESGLIYYDIVEGQGDQPLDGQEVVFHYTGYNEAGRRVDSSYQQGAPARTRLGIKGLIPGFEEGIRTMRLGGKRRLIIPPDLGPPVGPSTFFSAKQFEVFDVELLDVKDCKRRTIAFYSDVVCD